MPSVTYMNQSAPFWDFLASLEQQGAQHPLFSQNRETENENEDGQARESHDAPQPPFAPWTWGQQFFGGPGGMPHRGPPPHGPHPHQRDHNEEAEKAHDEKSGDQDTDMNNDKDAGNDNGEGPSGQSGSDNEHRPCGSGYHGRCGGGRRNHGRFGAHHGPPGHRPEHHRGPPHHHGHEGRHHGPRGPWGPRARRGPWGGFGSHPLASLFDPSTFGGAAGFDPANIAAQFWNQFNDSHPSNATKKDTTDSSEDHTPDADVFDTETAFVVHISLPGAKKEDVGVNWDAEKSELSVAGVIYRPGDEELLKTLALNERKVGAFERKIRLGTRATPAHVDAEGITAKLEDGVLRVEVPKMDGGFVEIRKVDIE